MDFAGVPLWRSSTRDGDHTVTAAAGFTAMSVGTGSLIIPGAGRPSIMDAGGIIPIAVGSGRQIGSGLRPG